MHNTDWGRDMTDQAVTVFPTWQADHNFGLPRVLTGPATKRERKWESLTGTVQHPCLKTPEDALVSWACQSEGSYQTGRLAGKSNQHKWLASSKIWSVEGLETLNACTELSTWHHWLLRGERSRKRKHCVIFFERSRKDRHQSDQQWNCLGANCGEPERWGGDHRSVSKPSWTEPHVGQ